MSRPEPTIVFSGFGGRNFSAPCPECGFPSLGFMTWGKERGTARHVLLHAQITCIGPECDFEWTLSFCRRKSCEGDCIRGISKMTKGKVYGG